jgi:hypothetical protein
MFRPCEARMGSVPVMPKPHASRSYLSAYSQHNCPPSICNCLAGNSNVNGNAVQKVYIRDNQTTILYTMLSLTKLPIIETAHLVVADSCPSLSTYTLTTQVCICFLRQLHRQSSVVLRECSVVPQSSQRS